MTVYLDELFSLDDLAKEIEAGYVRERFHPNDPSLRILNYTEAAQYDRRWNRVTTQCRGLIVKPCRATLRPRVIARPFAKFFNYGEGEASYDLDAPVEVLDKVDGSLGIIYRGPDGWAVATRGSFESEQAIRGTAMLREMLNEGLVMPPAGWTLLAEIIYPDNRIVVDYEGFEGLVLLGAVNVSSGRITGPATWPIAWRGPKAQRFEVHTLADALAMPPRPNAEGLVVRLRGSDTMLKVKQEDYVRLHRIITGLSERTVWEHLAEHGNIAGLIETLPDEFHDWVRTKADALIEREVEIYANAWAQYQALLDMLPVDFERREFANLATKCERSHLQFGLLDGHDIETAIWKELRPVGFNPMTHRSEDNA